MRKEISLFSKKRRLAFAIFFMGVVSGASHAADSPVIYSSDDQDEEVILTFGEEQELEKERAESAATNNFDSLNFTSWESPGFFRKIQYDGYVNGGFYSNTYGADQNRVFAGSESGLSLNGAYIAVAKEAQTNGNGFDWGMGVDFMFGEDSRFLRVEHGLDEKWDTGHNYGFAMPQVNATVAYNNWSFTGGHFYAPFGYESCRADERFFYSTGLEFDALPGTATGGLLTYSGFENFTTSVGLVNGVDQGFSGDAGGSVLVGNVVWSPREEASITYSLGVGDFVDRRWRHTSGNLHSFVVELKPDDPWTFVTTLDYENVDDEGGIDVDMIIAGYHVYYDVNSDWKVGTRAEWLRNKTAGLRAVNYFDLTVGANWTPDNFERLSVRPEVRFDASDARTYGCSGNKKFQLCLGVDALYSF